jgi:hypothetical protein
MFDQIPQNRILFYFFCLGMLPLAITVFFFFSSKGEISDLDASLEFAQQQVFIKEKKESSNLSVKQQFRDADHFYIDKYLETLVFLEPEIESLQQISKDKNFADDEKIKRRLETLSGSKNSMIFTEGIVQTTPQFQETTETLTNPIEINIDDLKKILARIEGIEIGDYTPAPNRPQLIITDMRLEKKKVGDTNEIFQLNLKLIKREFI